MGNPLQQRRTPAEFAAEAQLIEISAKVGDFEQLSEIVQTDLAALDADRIPPKWREQEVRGKLRFEFLDAQQALPAVRGEVMATANAVCQRCLGPFELELTASLNLLFTGENTVEIDGVEFEIWELGDEQLAIAELVEEALIMAIPFVPMHEGDKDCVAVGEADSDTEEMTLPFADLRAQMEREK